jgi:predicted transcriptional regulator
MAFTKIDNKLLELMETIDSKEIILYMAILSVKRENIPLQITNMELAKISGISINNISKCLKALEEKSLISRDGKIITDVRHGTNKLTGNFTMIDNDFLAEKIDSRAKLLFIKLVSLKADSWGYVKISQERLAECISLKDRTSIYRHVERLQETGWILDIKKGNGYNPCNYYKVKRVDFEALKQEQRKLNAKQQNEKYRQLKEKVGTGQDLTVTDLLEWFTCLVEKKGNVYNKGNFPKDKAVINNLLSKTDSNTLAKLIENYTNSFDRKFKNHYRKSIKLKYLGSDDVFNRVKNAYDFELEQSQAQEEEPSEMAIF